MIYCIALNIIIRLYETEVTIEVTKFSAMLLASR